FLRSVSCRLCTSASKCVERFRRPSSVATLDHGARRIGSGDPHRDPLVVLPLSTLGTTLPGDLAPRTGPGRLSGGYSGHGFKLQPMATEVGPVGARTRASPASLAGCVERRRE